MSAFLVGYEEEEQNRPQFRGEKILSPITGQPTLYYPHAARSRKAMYSQSVICGLVLVVIATVAVIFAIRIGISDTGFEIGGVQVC